MLHSQGVFPSATSTPYSNNNNHHHSNPPHYGTSNPSNVSSPPSTSTASPNLNTAEGAPAAHGKVLEGWRNDLVADADALSMGVGADRRELTRLAVQRLPSTWSPRRISLGSGGDAVYITQCCWVPAAPPTSASTAGGTRGGSSAASGVGGTGMSFHNHNNHHNTPLRLANPSLTPPSSSLTHILCALSDGTMCLMNMLNFHKMYLLEEDGGASEGPGGSSMPPHINPLMNTAPGATSSSGPRSGGPSSSFGHGTPGTTSRFRSESGSSNALPLPSPPSPSTSRYSTTTTVALAAGQTAAPARSCILAMDCAMPTAAVLAHYIGEGTGRGQRGAPGAGGVSSAPNPRPPVEEPSPGSTAPGGGLSPQHPLVVCLVLEDGVYTGELDVAVPSTVRGFRKNSSLHLVTSLPSCQQWNRTTRRATTAKTSSSSALENNKDSKDEKHTKRYRRDPSEGHSTGSETPTPTTSSTATTTTAAPLPLLCGFHTVQFTEDRERILVVVPTRLPTSLSAPPDHDEDTAVGRRGYQMCVLRAQPPPPATEHAPSPSPPPMSTAAVAPRNASKSPLLPSPLQGSDSTSARRRPPWGVPTPSASSDKHHPGEALHPQNNATFMSRAPLLFGGAARYEVEQDWRPFSSLPHLPRDSASDLPPSVAPFDAASPVLVRWWSHEPPRTSSSASSSAAVPLHDEGSLPPPSSFGAVQRCYANPTVLVVWSNGVVQVLQPLNAAEEAAAGKRSDVNSPRMRMLAESSLSDFPSLMRSEGGKPRVTAAAALPLRGGHGGVSVHSTAAAPASSSAGPPAICCPAVGEQASNLRSLTDYFWQTAAGTPYAETSWTTSSSFPAMTNNNNNNSANMGGQMNANTVLGTSPSLPWLSMQSPGLLAVVHGENTLQCYTMHLQERPTATSPFSSSAVVERSPIEEGGRPSTLHPKVWRGFQQLLRLSTDANPRHAETRRREEKDPTSPRDAPQHHPKRNREAVEKETTEDTDDGVPVVDRLPFELVLRPTPRSFSAEEIPISDVQCAFVVSPVVSVVLQSGVVLLLDGWSMERLQHFPVGRLWQRTALPAEQQQSNNNNNNTTNNNSRSVPMPPPPRLSALASGIQEEGKESGSRLCSGPRRVVTPPSPYCVLVGKPLSVCLVDHHAVAAPDRLGQK